MIFSKWKAPKAEPLGSLVGVTLPLIGCVSPEKCLNFSVPLIPRLENGQDRGPTSGLLMKGLGLHLHECTLHTPRSLHRQAKGQFKKQSVANGVEISVPVPSDADSPRFKTSVGSAKYVPEKNMVIWSIKSFPVSLGDGLGNWGGPC